MQRKKRGLMRLTAILISLIMSIAACSSAEKTDNDAAVTDAAAEETAAAGKTTAVEEAASTTMQDGTYEPAAFTVQGGSGKVTITCPEVTVSGGEGRRRL